MGMNADTQCVECGYALLGLADSAACPECGRAIEESVHPTLFAFLTDSDAKKLVRGINRLLLLLPLSAAFLLLLVGTVYTGGDEIVITCLISLTILVAVWLLGWNAIAGVRVAGTGSFLVRAAIGACILGVARSGGRQHDRRRQQTFPHSRLLLCRAFCRSRRTASPIHAPTATARLSSIAAGTVNRFGRDFRSHGFRRAFPRFRRLIPL